MATIYSPPPGFEPPIITPDDYKEHRWEAIESEYIERLAQDARRTTPANPLVGKVVHFPIADGYAQYMVWRTKPLQLMHLNLGDGWSIPDAHARGLRLADVRTMIENERRWNP